jgi:heterodisulfide reductase subunit A
MGIYSTIVENYISENRSKMMSVHFPSTTSITKEVPMKTRSTGSILVTGGGIAGIQAALDLADSGYYVYLIEKSPGIGGAMAKLDKTFPTNDCAM